MLNLVQVLYMMLYLTRVLVNAKNNVKYKTLLEIQFLVSNIKI